MNNKNEIIRIFNKNVRGKKPDLSSFNQNHDGKSGHWLEVMMNISPNAKNEPDLEGYEMKNETTSGKTTFGDWSADEYIFKKVVSKKDPNPLGVKFSIDKSNFFRMFGKPNIKKKNRYAWSGECCPSYFGEITSYGQRLDFDDEQNIVIFYSFSDDKRERKKFIMPAKLQKDNIVLARWYKDSLKKKLENKFNQKGFFICTTTYKIYDKIHFGGPINFDEWIILFKQGEVFFDSGMYEGNNRPYSQWRALNEFWYNRIEETY